jgi:hypothetical protein
MLPQEELPILEALVKWVIVLATCCLDVLGRSGLIQFFRLDAASSTV